MAEAAKEMMDIKSFLEIYGITRSNYFIQVKKGALKVSREGRRTYIKRRDAEEWLKNFGGS